MSLQPAAGAAVSEPALLALHGVRVLGAPHLDDIAALFGLDTSEVTEHLLDAEARGWVRRHRFPFGEPAPRAGAGPGREPDAGYTWALTESGRAANDRQLADELDRAAARPAVTAAHRDFVPLNRLLGPICTRWQLRPSPADPMAINDHRDWRWDERVIRDLSDLEQRLRPVTEALAGALHRLGVHGPRFAAAVGRVAAGDHGWVDAIDRPSCQLVWIQLHEDLLATLGIERGSDN